ncbi:hypothetical protein Pcinc_020183 [Petrolisthes cinctipes]|uniref:Uncharacterized protein n=1 Tax=Petrolisthes cinctipes TaxID=88211 RepID=A0AAE1FIL0_PETCI|nr:hypothetical protein Pcinc_020183 [Petrolisthes cinctipes]
MLLSCESSPAPPHLDLLLPQIYPIIARTSKATRSTTRATNATWMLAVSCTAFPVAWHCVEGPIRNRMDESYEETIVGAGTRWRTKWGIQETMQVHYTCFI